MQAITGIFALIVWAFFILGWLMNLVTLAHMSHLNGMAVLRVIGIFLAPLGGILGWF